MGTASLSTRIIGSAPIGLYLLDHVMFGKTVSWYPALSIFIQPMSASPLTGLPDVVMVTRSVSSLMA